MTVSAVPDNIARGWKRAPDHVANGSDQHSLSAALWIGHAETTVDVTAEPLHDRHIIGLQLRPLTAQAWRDGKASFSGTFAPGETSMVPAGVRPRTVMHGKFACLHLYVPDALLTATVRQEGLSLPSGRIELVDPKRVFDPLIQRIGREVVSEMREKLPLSRLRVDALGLDLAVQLLRRYSGDGHAWAKRNLTVKGGLTAWQLRRCQEILASDLAQNHSLAAIAGEIGLSTFHFARAFKQSEGIPPHAYLTNLRMARAKALLTGTNVRITEIAFEVGYESSQAFSRVFRRHFGCSPREFRRNGSL